MTSVGLMASSVVAEGPAITTSSTEIGTAIGSSNPIPSPSDVAVGDLLVGVAALDTGIAVPSASTGWILVGGTISSGSALRAWARVADGTANDTFTIGAAGVPSEDYCAAMLRITRHLVGSGTVATDIKNNASTGTSASPDPASIASLPLTTRLWLVLVAIDRSAALETIAAVPSNYTSAVSLVSSATATSTALAIAQRSLKSTVEDPGTFTVSASVPWATITLAIP